LETFVYESAERQKETEGIHYSGQKKEMGILTKTKESYQNNMIGVVSITPWRFMGTEIKRKAKHPKLIALIGRVPVKVNAEGGAILAGDRITSSSMSGVGMKATKAGPAIGIALSSFSGTGVGMIMAYVSNHIFVPEENQRALKKLSYSKNDFLEFFSDAESLKNLKTMMQVFLGSPQKNNLEDFLKLTPHQLRKLAFWSQKMLRNIDFSRQLSEDEISKILEKAMVVKTPLLIKGDFIKLIESEKNQKKVTFVSTDVHPHLLDRGESLWTNGMARVQLDPKFLELTKVSELSPLQIQLSPTSPSLSGNLIVTERGADYFVVEDIKDGKRENSRGTFSWQVSALKREASLEHYLEEESSYLRRYLE